MEQTYISDTYAEQAMNEVVVHTRCSYEQTNRH